MLECDLSQTSLSADELLMELSVIIINWNAAADTIRCVQDLASWRRVQPTIWVVDNASTDGNADIIKRDSPPKVHLIHNDTNLGYSGGNNRGLVAALAQSDAPIMLLNNDASIAEDDIIRLIETIQTNPHISFIGPLLCDAEQPDRLLNAGGRNMVWHHQSHISKIINEPIQIVDYVSGTVLVGRAETFRVVGLLDENYFFNGETPDVCWRAKQLGYINAVDTRARAFHALGRSSRWRETLYAYYAIRNRFLFIQKFYRRLIKFLLYSFWILYSLVLSLKLQVNGKPHAAHAVRMGLRDGLRGQFGGQNERVLAVCDPPSS
jgi:GT2 family glycosyltransferase